MSSHFVISTYLHMFQSFHISQKTQHNIFFVERNLKCDFVNELPGKVVYFERLDTVAHSVISAITAKIKKRKRALNLFFGNQVHSIVSHLMNRCDYESYYVLDDGLQYFGKGVEIKNLRWFLKNKIIRNVLCTSFSSVGVDLVSTRDYLYFPKKLKKVKLITFMLSVNDTLKLNYDLPLIRFEDYFDFKKQRLIGHKYFGEHLIYKFLSHQESEAFSHNPSMLKGRIEPVLHPKFRKVPVPCPYEFARPENIYSISPKSSLFYVMEFVSTYES